MPDVFPHQGAEEVQGVRGAEQVAEGRAAVSEGHVRAGLEDVPVDHIPGGAAVGFRKVGQARVSVQYAFLQLGEVFHLLRGREGGAEALIELVHDVGEAGEFLGGRRIRAVLDAGEAGRRRREGDVLLSCLGQPVKGKVYLAVEIDEAVVFRREGGGQLFGEEEKEEHLLVEEAADLAQEGIEARKAGQPLAEGAALLFRQRGDSMQHRGQRGRGRGKGAYARRAACAQRRAKGRHLGGRVDAEAVQPLPDLVQQAGLGLLFQHGGLVIRREGLLDVLRLVGEVQHEGILLAGSDTVEAGQGLDGLDAFEGLVHEHGMQQGLVKAGLVLLGHDEDLEILFEAVRQVPFRDLFAVYGGIELLFRPGAFLIAAGYVLHLAGKGHQRTDAGQAARTYLAVEFLHVAHGVQARARHQHGLGPAIQLVGRDRAEVLQHDGGLLGDVVRVQIGEAQRRARPGQRGVDGVIRRFAHQLEIGLPGGVIAQHIQDEALFDGLPHGIDVEGAKAPVLLLLAEKLQRPGLGRGREGEKGKVAMPALRGQLLPYLVLFHLVQVFGAAFQIGVFLQRGIGIGQRARELERGPAGLRGMGLIHDDGKFVVAVAHLPKDDREFLQGGHDDGPALVDGVAQVGGALADGTHQALDLLKLADRRL